jgi:hypothetical protein
MVRKSEMGVLTQAGERYCARVNSARLIKSVYCPPFQMNRFTGGSYYESYAKSLSYSKQMVASRQVYGFTVLSNLGFSRTSSCGTAADLDHVSKESGSNREASSNGVRPLRLALAVLLI